MNMPKEDSELSFGIDQNNETDSHRIYYTTFESQYNELNTLIEKIDGIIDELHHASPELLYALFTQSIDYTEELSFLIQNILDNASQIFCPEYMSKQIDEDKLKYIKLEVSYTTKFEGLSLKIKEIIRFESKNKKQMSSRETISYVNHVGQKHDSIPFLPNDNISFNSFGDHGGSFSTDSIKNDVGKQIEELKQLDTCITYNISKILELINKSQQEYYISGPPSEGQSNRRSLARDSMHHIVIFVIVMFIICVIALLIFVYFSWTD